MKDKDLHQSRQIGGIKTQLKFMHSKIKMADLTISIMLLAIIILGLAVIALAV